MSPAPASLTRATVVFDGGSVTIMPRRAPVGNSAPIRGHALAVFPGAPPAHAANAISATVEAGGQPAFALLDLDERDAVALGHSLGLPELLYWDGRRAQVLPCE